jgi:hypothetical protein
MSQRVAVHNLTEALSVRKSLDPMNFEPFLTVWHPTAGNIGRLEHMTERGNDHRAPGLSFDLVVPYPYLLLFQTVGMAPARSKPVREISRIKSRAIVRNGYK